MGLRVSLPRRRDDEIQAICDATPRAMIKTGTYAGNGADNRDIDIGVNLASKDNVYVVIKSNGAHMPCHRIEYGQGDVTMFYGVVGDSANCIQSFTATGFQIGSDDMVNNGANTYRYIAFWEEP